jgi:hypothetical protein
VHYLTGDIYGAIVRWWPVVRWSWAG